MTLFSPMSGNSSTQIIVEEVLVDVEEAVREMRVEFDQTTQQSTDTIKAGSHMTRVSVEIDDTFDAGTTLELGHAGDTDLLMQTTDINALKVGRTEKFIDLDWDTVNRKLILTVNGVSVNGHGYAVAQYVEVPQI